MGKTIAGHSTEELSQDDSESSYSPVVNGETGERPSNSFGQDVYLPITAPHRVTEHSAPLSAMARARASERIETLYKTNHILRRWGRTPARIGESPGRDVVIHFLSKAMRSVREGK